jgi:hypothetical protein
VITRTHGEQDLGRRRQQGNDAHACTLPMATTMLTLGVTPQQSWSTTGTPTRSLAQP